MNATALQRQAALAGAALLAMLLVVVLDRPGGETSVATPPPPVSQAEWETATVWVTRPKDWACDQVSQGATGVVHPVLPCGVKLVVSANGEEIRTEVVGAGPVATGSDFALTPPLAKQLDVTVGDRIRWRFAG
jgi:hypothetical protein